MGKILIIEARFYENIADSIADAAIEVIEKAGYEYDRIEVPGAFEIPAAISFALDGSKKYVGYLALGCVIRGETSHYDHVCEECARGLNDLAIKHKLAIGFGVITAENKTQAEVRADKNKKNLGGKAAATCIKMIELKEKLKA